MTSPQPPPESVLQLRRRDAEWIDRPATLDEFARPAPAEVRDPYGALAELLVADLIARTHYGVDSLAGGRVMIGCEIPRYGVPLGPRDLEAPAVEDWRIRELLVGELLDAGPDGRLARSLAAQVRRGLIAVAGALPLLASPLLAHAGNPGSGFGPGAAELETLVALAPPPKLPEEPAPSPTLAAEAPTPAAEGPAPQPEPASQPTTAPAVSPQPGAAPPPRMSDALTLTGTNVWTGLLDKRVQLAMKNGQTLDGTVVAQSSSDLALARTSDGTVVSVPKAEVAGVRLRLDGAGAAGGSDVPLSERPLEDGRGLHAGGVVMVSLGSAFALAGTVMLGIYPSGLFIHLPLLIPGLAMIGGGSAMLFSAGKKKKAFNAAWGVPTSKLRVTPTLGVSRNGGHAGLVLRF